VKPVLTHSFSLISESIAVDDTLSKIDSLTYINVAGSMGLASTTLI